jgi:predicted GIY-YIG superfamily endonuclease
MSFFVYWIQSGPRAYIGATVNPKKRLRQHNGEIAGGAARTRNRGPWHFHCVIGGFRTWKEALQYEWAAKYYTRRARGISARKEALEELNRRDRWTSNSPPAAEVPLTLDYEPKHYGSPPDVYNVSTTTAAYRKSTSSSTRAARSKKRKFTKSLHNVHY